MVRVFGAGTLPVNTPNDTIILTRDTLWPALERKIRKPSEFVPILSGCTIHSDKDGAVDREVTLNFGNGERDQCMKLLLLMASSGHIKFQQQDKYASCTTNLISYLPSVNESELYLTYIFEWEWPNIKEGSPELAELTVEMSKMAIIGVEKSLERARELIAEKLI